MKKIFFGVIVIFIIAELAIRLTLFFYYLYCTTVARPPLDFDNESYRILCIGESTTYGFPVHGNGYPEQLEQLLNKNIHNKRFKVFNLGVIAITSNETARHFYKNIIDYKPNLAIILVGNNNNDPRLFNIHRDNFIISRAGFYLLNELNSLKIVKLTKFSYEILNGLATNKLQIKRIYSDIYISYDKPNYTHYSQEEIDRNLKYMVDVASRNRCPVLICNYFNSPANSFVRDFAATRKIPFCDNEIIFKEYKNGYSELISEDGWHPNAKGYSIMARNLYETIIRYNLI